MAKLVTLILLSAMFGATGLADQLLLADERRFSSDVAFHDETISVGAEEEKVFRSPKNRPLKAAWDRDPTPKLPEKLKTASPGNLYALWKAVQWADRHGLSHQARQICRRIVRPGPENLQAGRRIGQIKVNGRWVNPTEAIELARSKLQAGAYQEVMNDLLPQLEAATRDEPPSVRLEVDEIKGQAQLRNGQFRSAEKTFRMLAARSDPPANSKYLAIAEILAANSDGMYVLCEPYPPTAGLLQSDQPSLQPGPASLSDPMVLEAALRDRAKEEIKIGRQFLEAARTLETPDPMAAEDKYEEALEAFDRADAMVANISYSYRVEIARRRIATARKKAEEIARQFDELLNSLGCEELSSDNYREMIAALADHLDEIQQRLNTILEVAQPYPRELILEIQWAEADLRKIKELRSELAGELDENKK